MTRDDGIANASPVLLSLLLVAANRDAMPHTVTADDGSFDSGDIAPGASWRTTFGEVGEYRYHCAPHAAQDKTGAWKGMIGTVVVEA